MPIISTEPQDPPPPTVEQAKAQLEAAKRAQREGAERLERERREEERLHDELVEQAKGVGENVARILEGALAYVEANPVGVVPPSHRQMCRQFLRGLLPSSNDLQAAEGQLCGIDGGLRALYGAIGEARARINSLTNYNAASFLNEADEAVVAISDLEAEAWRAWMRRVRELAGED